jgi:hypothetical protein
MRLTSECGPGELDFFAQVLEMKKEYPLPPQVVSD